jgi:magnesium transporter
MIYEFADALNPIELSDVDDSRLCAGMVSLEELRPSERERLGFGRSCYEECTKPESRFRSVIEVADGHMFSVISVRNVASGMFVRKNLFLLVSLQDADGSTARAFENAMHRLNVRTISIERVICAFFEQLVYQDSGALESYENKIGNLEEQIEKGTTGKSFNAEILSMRRRLLIVRHYYEQMLDVFETMLENDADLFSDENAGLFRMMRDKIERLSNNTQLLRDSLVQVREAYMAALDYSANRIMKVFTVVTTVFLPLTLIAGWYGMNFKFMPELTWRFGYLGVIVLSIAVVFFSIAVFKKKNLF